MAEKGKGKDAKAMELDVCTLPRGSGTPGSLPLPMMRVLEALAKLKLGEKLLVHHVRRPVHLLARLEEEGHAYLLKDLGPGQVKILIQKGG